VIPFVLQRILPRSRPGDLLSCSVGPRASTSPACPQGCKLQQKTSCNSASLNISSQNLNNKKVKMLKKKRNKKRKARLVGQRTDNKASFGKFPPVQRNIQFVERFSKKAVAIEVLQNQSSHVQLWRHCGSGLDRLRNSKRLNRKDMNVAAAWTLGIVSFKLPKGVPVSNRISYDVRKTGPRTYVMRNVRSLRRTQEFIKFLYHAQAKIYNVFGSLADACRVGDAALNALSKCLYEKHNFNHRFRDLGDFNKSGHYGSTDPRYQALLSP
jgi:hypothetical protein